MKESDLLIKEIWKGTMKKLEKILKYAGMSQDTKAKIIHRIPSCYVQMLELDNEEM